MCIAGTEWMGVRVDFLSALFVGLVAIASIITSQDAGNTNCFGIHCLKFGSYTVVDERIECGTHFHLNIVSTKHFSFWARHSLSAYLSSEV